MLGLRPWSDRRSDSHSAPCTCTRSILSIYTHGQQTSGRAARLPRELALHTPRATYTTHTFIHTIQYIYTHHTPARASTRPRLLPATMHARARRTHEQPPPPSMPPLPSTSPPPHRCLRSVDAAAAALDAIPPMPSNPPLPPLPPYCRRSRRCRRCRPPPSSPPLPPLPPLPSFLLSLLLMP